MGNLKFGKFLAKFAKLQRLFKMAVPPATDHIVQQARSRLEAFRRLKRANQLTPELVSRLAQDEAADFMAHRQAGDAITLLCEIAVLPDNALLAPGVKALFSMIVEPLADSFEPQDCAAYYAAFSQVIQFCRRLPAGRPLDARLTQFGLRSERDFLERMRRITRMKKFDLTQAEQVKKALVLSRVTLGADVEITSIIWQKLKQVFPTAEIVLLANEKAGELFSGDPTIRLHPVKYHRGGGLIDRLSSWLNVVGAIDEHCRHLRPEEFVIVDPDSRLTQLGLLPAVRDEAPYYFFESRSYRKPGLPNLGQLTAQWVNEVFGEGEPLYPCVCLRRDDAAFAKAFVGQIRNSGARRLISLNFGTGENPNKRIPDPFESQLLLSLLRERAVIVLDKGMGTEEAQRVEAIVQTVRQHGKRVIEITDKSAPRTLQSFDLHADMFTWQGGIGRFSALMAQTDQYIGYDSAGQHIAAALGIPTVVVFAGYGSPLFIERWRPAGRGFTRCVLADAQHLTGEAKVDQLVSEVVHAAQQVQEPHH